MRYAEVAVDARIGHSRSFSYHVPERFSVEPGQLVWVPLGRRITQGIVMELVAVPQVEVTRDILQAVMPSPLVDPLSLDLARWLSRYYLCSLFDAISLMLPPGFHEQVRSRIIAMPIDAIAPTNLAPRTQDALRQLASKAFLSELEFVSILGRGGKRELVRLLENGLIRRQVDLPRPRLAPSYRCYLFPIDTRSFTDAHDSNRSAEPARRAWRQISLLNAVRTHSQHYLASLASKEFGRETVSALVEKGLIGLEWLRVEAPVVPSPDSGDVISSLALTSEQADALAKVRDVVDNPAREPRSFLLHGVTGSGKTEVYLRAMQRVVDRGEQVIFLVPEIALTSQILQQMSARFPGRVAILHSGLTPRQRFDQWWSIRENRFDIVVGPRSALFAPVSRLGMIVIDEEHEWTYKQEEGQPLYHARTVALKQSQLFGAVVLLGTATPDVSSYYHALRGRHQLLKLPHRIRQAAWISESELANVEICDMRQELREGNRSIFSRRLAQSLEYCIHRGQQAILFLNRRGSAPIVQCRNCGDTMTCRRCSVSLTYHSTESKLVCHRCNQRTMVPRSCRQCGSERIRQLGIGTQRVVDEVLALLPGVQVDRWDADTTGHGPGHQETLRRFSDGETQVLVGTQIVAKGLHIPNVTLVGVVLADVGLYLPDFRAGERSFGLLCQVAGRAGRGIVTGRVIIQTYSPEHYAITAAAAQDYDSLYQQEIACRYQQGNPPFNQLIHFVYQDIDATICQRRAMAMGRMLRQKVYAQGLVDVGLIGPAPGIPSRLRGRYRWHLILRGRDLHRLLEGVDVPPGCTVDVDPVHVL
jgi:primosomal protein N' (replication factor Y)